VLLIDRAPEAQHVAIRLLQMRYIETGGLYRVEYVDTDLHKVRYHPADVATTGVNWTGCTDFTIGSGSPNFTYWGHGIDLSLYDELRIFNKALTQTEIQTIISDED